MDGTVEQSKDRPQNHYKMSYGNNYHAVKKENLAERKRLCYSVLVSCEIASSRGMGPKPPSSVFFIAFLRRNPFILSEQHREDLAVEYERILPFLPVKTTNISDAAAATMYEY